MNPRILEIQAGLAGLKVWLSDTIHLGLAELSGKPESFWVEAAARVTDAKARGIANRILRIPALFEQPDWRSQVLEALGQLYLITEAFQKIESLPQPMQADLQTLAGINIRKEDLLARPGIRDEWLVIGRYIEKEVQPRIDLQRIWLIGKQTGHLACLMDYSFNGAPFPYRYTPGTCFQGEVIFYPGAYPLRVVLRLPVSLGSPLFRPVGWPDVRTMLTEYATALGKNPFLETFPAWMEDIHYFYHEGNFIALDKMKNQVPISMGFEHEWELFAFAGGNPVSLFGEWDGKSLHPLSALDGQRLISL